ncbi:unnamed protein product [Gadus morhua 'NCC']
MFSLSPAIVLFRKIPVYRDSGLVQSERSPPAEVTVSSPLTAYGSKGICLSLSLLPASDLNSKAAEGGRAACVMCKHIAHSVRWGRVWLHRPDDVVSLRQGLWLAASSLPPRCLLATPPFTADATETLRSSRLRTHSQCFGSVTKQTLSLRWRRRFEADLVGLADEAPIAEENRENTSPSRHRSPVKTPPLKGSSKDRQGQELSWAVWVSYRNEEGKVVVMVEVVVVVIGEFVLVEVGRSLVEKEGRPWWGGGGLPSEVEVRGPPGGAGGFPVGGGGEAAFLLEVGVSLVGASLMEVEMEPGVEVFSALVEGGGVSQVEAGTVPRVPNSSADDVMNA